MRHLKSFGISFLGAGSAVILGGFLLYKEGALPLLSLKESASLSFRMAVIDMELIEQTAQPFLKVKNFLEDQHKKFHAEILKQETDLRKELESLREADSSKDPSFSKKKEKFELKVAELEQKVQKRKEELEEESRRRYSQLSEKTQKIMQAIRKRKGIDVILTTSFLNRKIVLYHQNHIDLTEEVIQNLNTLN